MITLNQPATSTASQLNTVAPAKARERSRIDWKWRCRQAAILIGMAGGLMLTVTLIVVALWSAAGWLFFGTPFPTLATDFPELVR